MTGPAPRESDEREDPLAKERRAVDQERSDRRELHDRTRQHTRGASQTQAGLARERAEDDASLEDERERADRTRSRDRSRSDKAAREQAALLDAAEDRLDTVRAEEDAAGLERRDALRAADAELARLHGALENLQLLCRGTGLELIAEVEVAQACAGRIGRVLARALDPQDLRGHHHDVGGSG